LAAIIRAGGSGEPEAEELDLQALALATQLGMRPLAARCHLALAESDRRRGENARAVEHWGRARALLDALDMRVEG
jgi:hypothetical protein